MKSGILNTILIVLFVAAAVLLVMKTDLRFISDVNYLLGLKDALIAKAPLASIGITLGLYLLFSFIFLPMVPLSILAGTVFGFWQGALITLIGSAITMSCSFLWVRYFFKSLFSKLTNRIKLLRNLMASLSSNGRTFVFYARLLFLTPFNALNIVCGLSAMPVRDYALYSILGAIPSALFYAYAGSRLNEMRNMADIKRQGLILSVVIILFFAGVWLLKKIVTRNRELIKSGKNDPE